MRTNLIHCWVVVVLIAPGCGQGKLVVKGTVTYNDKPLSSGQVNVLGSGGVARSALIGPDGGFELLDPPLGEAKVAVVSFRKDSSAKGPSLGEKKGVVKLASLSAIPARYKDFTTSGLVVNIARGNRLRIELTD